MKTDNYEKAKRMNMNASECLQKDDYIGALEYFSEALKFLPEDMREAKARLYSNKGHAFVSIKNYEEALSSFKKALELFQRLGDKIRIGEQLGNIGSVYRDQGMWDASLGAYFDALGIFQEMAHKEGVADQYSNIAYSFSRKEELETAVQFFEKAKILYGELENYAKEQLCDQNLKAMNQNLKSLE